jgi:hypothetical protein
MIGLVLLLALVVAVAGAVGAVALAMRSRRQFVAANELIPGRPTRAPASWAGSHDPEAVLHRRLRDAMAALRANQAFDHDGGLLDVRVELEEQALAIDDELVAVAALPRLHRHEPLRKVTEAVNSIETAVAELASRAVTESGPRLEDVLRRIRERTTLVDEIRAELDQLPDAGTDPATGGIPGSSTSTASASSAGGGTPAPPPPPSAPGEAPGAEPTDPPGTPRPG